MRALAQYLGEQSLWFRLFDISPPVAMTSIVDSKAHFSKRCAEIGMSARALASLTANGYETIGMLAFAIGQPGVALVDDSIQAFARATFGAGAAMSDVTALKRMVFESHTMVLAQLREQV